MELEREMVNPKRSWSGVIIKCSERGDEIVGAPLRSHTLEPMLSTLDAARRDTIPISKLMPLPFMMNCTGTKFK